MSAVQILGQGFGTAKERIYLPDANRGGGNFTFRLHPDDHILSWSDNVIEIIVPSMGYFSDTQNGLNSCAGTGIVELYRAQSLGGEYVQSPMPLFIPYAVNNFAENPENAIIYTPHEVRLHNANSHGGYTFVYDASFYNNAPALAAFRRALKTWRCATGIHFKDICSENVFCETDEASTRVLVSFAKDCFDTSTPHCVG